MSGDAAIEARALTKRYGRSRGIFEVNLSIAPGAVVGLVGANGAGKTTFMRVLLDFIRPTSGSLSVFGLDSSRDSLAVRRRTAYLPGELVFPARLTGEQVLRRFAFSRNEADMARAPALADRLNLDLTRRIGDLSKGNKQKVGLVLAFAPRTELIVLDEPTSGLDPLLQREFGAIVREATAEGRTVLLSSHVMSEVGHLTSEVALMREGSLIAVESMNALRARARRRGIVRLVQAEESGALSGALASIKGVSDVEVTDEAVNFAVQGSVDGLVKALASFSVAALDLSHADLEDAFFAAYAKPGIEAGGATPAGEA